jgi:GTP-binding protein
MACFWARCADNSRTMSQRQNNHYYRQAKFLISAASKKQFPTDGSIEVAFVGRSNAGKSSAINALCDNKSLAKISKTPGRTRLVNYFSIDEQRSLVDLPGYGYAKVPHPVKQEWKKLMEQYLQRSESLRGLVIIMDIRHPLKEFNIQMLDWCQHFGLPAHLLLTKADKLKKGPAQATLLKIKKELGNQGYDASVQIFSALKKTGLDELVSKMNDWMNLPQET